jgi:very-short-patch-repair endonuclease
MTKARQHYSSTLLLGACTTGNQGMATREQLLTAGLTRRLLSRALATGDLVRLRRGVYALGPLPARSRHLLSNGQLDLGYLAATRAVVLSLDGVADRRTAALLWGMDQLVEPTHVECRVGRSQRRVSMKGVDVRVSVATGFVLHPAGGLDPVPVTTAVDTVLDCAMARPMLEAVVIADSALRVGCVSLDDLVAGASERRGPKTARLRRLLALMDPDSGSVLESMLRFLLVTNGLHPVSQFTVHRGKQVVGRFDFCFEAARLIVECDGRRWHDPEDVRRKDRHRDNALQRLGWRILRFDWNEVRSSPTYVLECVRDCLKLPAVAA